MRRGKRTLDLALSAGALLLFSPLLLVIAMFVKAEDGAAVLFGQERVGRGGRLFRMWKFRTMIPNAGNLGSQITAANDSRITRVGAWLRERKLDELPQLFNVLVGDMSLVGPRPEVPKYVATYTPEQQRVLELKPGITDRASILFANESELLAEASDPERVYVERIMPEKIRINLEYARTATTLRDIKVILQTLRHLYPLTNPRARQARRTTPLPPGGFSV